MPFPVDPRWITATEEKLGVRFPASFVTAMTRHNGGTVVVDHDTTAEDEFTLHPFLDQSDRTRLKRTTGSIDRETKWNREHDDYLPRNAVVIGNNGGGDLLVLLPMEDDSTSLQHTIYRYNHETGETEAIAEDFAEVRVS